MRNVGNHWFQTFMPSIMICFTSTMSVFIPHQMMPAGRMGMCVTSLLSLISLFNGVRLEWVKTTQIRAIDVWTLLCYIGVVYALIEYCIILHWTTRKNQDNTEIKPLDVIEEEKNKALKASRLEKISQILLPLYNMFFIALFFMICLIRQSMMM